MGKAVSVASREKMRKRMLGKKNEQSIAWTGDKVGYFGIHDWLKLNYGKADICENSWCLGLSDVFQWAKIEGKKYERKRENFIKLCVRCHVRYDRGYNVKI